MADPDQNSKLDEVLETLHQLIADTNRARTDQQPGPSNTKPSSSCDRALSVLRQIRGGINSEQRENFIPYSRKGKKKKRSPVDQDFPFSKKKDESSWLHRFVCLASRSQERVPSPSEKSLLSSCGLGEKMVRFPSLYLSYEESMDVLIGAFPKLAECGGFEFLKCLSNTRDLVLIPLQSSKYNQLGNSIPSQLQRKGGHGRIYIRPIQCDLPLEIDDEDGDGLPVR